MSAFNFTWDNDAKKKNVMKGKSVKTVNKKTKTQLPDNTSKKALEVTANKIKKKGFSKAPKKITPDKPFPKAPKKISNDKGFPKAPQHIDSDKGFPKAPTQISNDKGFPKAPNMLVKRKHIKDKSNKTDNFPLANKPVKTYSLFSEGAKDVSINTNIPGKSVIENVFSSGGSFSDLNLHEHILSNLQKHNFTELTNVQRKCIPEIQSGKNVLVRSQTGSGKTLAYAVPLLDKIKKMGTLKRGDGVQIIIIVPTRELALQTYELFGKINTFQWIVVGSLCGGENRNTEKSRLRKGVHILVSTPGRLLDHLLHTEAFKTDNVKHLVLDEADRLLDMGFKKDVMKIVEEINKYESYNPLALLKSSQKESSEVEKVERQTILLSATLTKGIAELADFCMKTHVYIDSLDESLNINPDHMIIPNTVKQTFLLTNVKHRLFVLAALLLSKAKHNSKIFVFMATSQMVDYHYELFSKYLFNLPLNRGQSDQEFSSDEEDNEQVMDVPFFKLHGNMEQSNRKQIFTSFRSSKKGILICTDVVARGIDVPEADLIIQYTAPQSNEDYLHRVGRTGRAGKSGSAILFLTHEEQEYVTQLQQHKVFLKEYSSQEYYKCLCDIMKETDKEKAATRLQERFEDAVTKDPDLHRQACLAYTSWSRFYNTYSQSMRQVFDFKKINLGHYVTSFAIKDTPSVVAKVVRGQHVQGDAKKLNKRLQSHEHQETKPQTQKRKIKSISLTTSEFSSGLPSNKKKRTK